MTTSLFQWRSEEDQGWDCFVRMISATNMGNIRKPIYHFDEIVVSECTEICHFVKMIFLFQFNFHAKILSNPVITQSVSPECSVPQNCPVSSKSYLLFTSCSKGLCYHCPHWTTHRHRHTQTHTHTYTHTRMYVCIVFLAWSSIAQSVCQQAFSLLANRCLRSWVWILHSADRGRQLVSFRFEYCLPVPEHRN